VLVVNFGTFYGIGIGPGDPELLTIKAASVLRRCQHVFVPKAEIGKDSTALDIARQFINSTAQIHAQTFPMTADRELLSQYWREAAAEVAGVLKQGKDACFLTLGDCLLYSTYIYLLRELQAICPDVPVVTIPGINSFSAAAALTQFPLGEGKESIHIVPTADDLKSVRSTLKQGGTVVLMKVGNRLAEIIKILDADGLLDQAVFVARAGQAGQRIETDLRKLEGESVQAGYLSIILVHAGKRGEA
jgi:precorrin-2/cobalt-factor-2 C20-methyltransferase